MGKQFSRIDRMLRKKAAEEPTELTHQARATLMFAIGRPRSGLNSLKMAYEHRLGRDDRKAMNSELDFVRANSGIIVSSMRKLPYEPQTRKFLRSISANGTRAVGKNEVEYIRGVLEVALQKHGVSEEESKKLSEIVAPHPNILAWSLVVANMGKLQRKAVPRRK
ncbi:MAG: hypothetical protein ABIG96_06795 [Candidatus Micrarchaeota archaeon]